MRLWAACALQNAARRRRNTCGWFWNREAFFKNRKRKKENDPL